MIAARGGSKGLPRKNLAALAGRPLIVHTIDSARSCARLDRTIVSTEDAEIAAVARAAGAEVILRADHLAGDLVRAVTVVADLIDSERWADEDIVVLLPPTSPLRTGADIAEALHELESDSDAESIISVTEFEFPPALALRPDGRYVRPVEGERYRAGATQRHLAPQLLRPNGAIYAARVSSFRDHSDFFTPRTIGLRMPRERSVDIDTEFDLTVAEALLRRG